MAVILGLPLLVRADRLRPQVENTLSEMTGRRVEIQSLHYSLRHRALVGSDFVIADDPGFGSVPFLQARSVELDIPFWSLVLGHTPQASRVVFDSPTIVLKENGQNRWNYSSLFTAARSRSNIPPPALEIRAGRLGVETDNAQLFQVQNLELSIPDPDWHTAFSFTLSSTLMHHGKLKVKGQAGPIDWDQSAPGLPISALIDLKGFDLSEWNWGSGASHLGGSLSIDGSLESNGRLVDLNGQATASKFRLSGRGQGTADPAETVFTLHHDLDAHTGELRRCDIRVSKGIATLTGTYNTGGSSLDLDLNLSLSGAPVTQMAQFLPALGILLPPGAALEGGVVDSALKFQGPADHPAISGSLSVDDTRLNRFRLSQRLETVSGLDAQELDDTAEILSWKATLSSNGSGIAVQNLVTDVAGLGELSGNGTVSLDGGVHFNMSGIRGLTGPKGASIPFTIGGDSHDPVFQPGGGKQR